MKQLRNVYGQPLTKSGDVDQRHYGTGKKAKPPEKFYDCVERPTHPKPWHVLQTDVATGRHQIISRHTTQRAALQRCERERALQPDRNPSAKLKHILRIDDSH